MKLKNVINKHKSNKIKENSNTVRHLNNGTDHRHSKSCCDQSSPARRTMKCWGQNIHREPGQCHAFVSPDHQQPRYQISRINGSSPSRRNDFNCLCHLNAEKWYNMLIYFSSKWFSTSKVNSLWPNDAMWRQRSWSTLAQVMACCLTAPSHYLNQCWLIISKV